MWAPRSVDNFIWPKRRMKRSPNEAVDFELIYFIEQSMPLQDTQENVRPRHGYRSTQAEFDSAGIMREIQANFENGLDNSNLIENLEYQFSHHPSFSAMLDALADIAPTIISCGFLQTCLDALALPVPPVEFRFYCQLVMICVWFDRVELIVSGSLEKIQNLLFSILMNISNKIQIQLIIILLAYLEKLTNPGLESVLYLGENKHSRDEAGSSSQIFENLFPFKIPKYNDTSEWTAKEKTKN